MAPSIEVAGGGDEASTAGGITASFTVAENSPDAVEGAAGAVLGLITLSDPDADDTHTVTVDNDHFQVIDHAGAKWLTLKSGVSLDFEENETVTLTVTVTDSGDPAESASAEVTIMVTDVNEAPSIDVRDGEEVPGHAGVVSSLTIAENAMRADAPPLALIEVMDPDAADQDHLKGEAGIAATSVSDDRFAVILDPEMGLWLHLAEGASLDYEAESHHHGGHVEVTVTFTDSAGNTASQDVTVMVTDVNEGPEVTGEVDPVTTLAGQAIKADPIDLLMLFTDPDEGDAPVRYEVSDAPSWLKFSVEYGTDDDGNDYAHGILTGTPPTTTADSDAATKVTLTATDGGGESASAHFYVIVDDGNDAITGVDLIDSNGNVAVEGDVDENDDSGVVFGEIRVHDQDHAMHPNGMHLIQVLRGDSTNPSPNAPLDNRFEVKYDDAGIPWLVLKEGMSLDEEKENGAVDVTIRAVDMNGATNSRGTAFTGDVEFQTVTIVINDKNDAPKAGTIGNWWVTAEDRQRSEDIQKGEWLDFSLELPGDAKPAFTDPDGDRLTYSLTGPSILEINKSTGQITNVEGGVPVRGVHKFTVTATDPSGASDSASFYVSIALSGDGTDASANDDNDAPRFGNPQEVDYPENSGDRRVATFTVRDEDNDLGHHPFALDTVVITSVVNADDSADPNNDATVAANDMTGYGGAFRLSKPVKSGDTWTYELWVRDTNPSARIDTTSVLDPDRDTNPVDRITVTVTANDNTAAAVTEEITIRIDDTNDKPVAGDITSAAYSGYGVAQSEEQKEVLYIRLEDVWTDQEDDPDDLTFGVSVSGSWIKILHGPADWGDIQGGRDGTIGSGDDDVEWGSTTGQTAVVIGESGAPEANEQVVIIELDRTGMNNAQNDTGSFTLSATDRDGATTSREYKITPTDQNLNPVNAVSLSGSAREDATLRATFNDDRDPDLGGDAMPAVVVYQWFRGAEEDGSDATAPFHQGTGDSYRLTQTDVGMYVTVKVKYYEVFGGQLVGFDTTSTTVTNQAITPRMVSNTPDKGAGSITVLADENNLTVVDEGIRVTDGDYGIPGLVAQAGLSVSWQVSDNGRGGWDDVPASAGTVSSDGLTLSLDSDGSGTSAAAAGNGQSKFYRAVVTYNANNDDDDDDTTTEEMESVYSDPVQVANIRDATATAPTISGSAFPGGTLSVDVRNTSVQWQEQRGTDWVDIAGATGDLAITQAHAGKVIRAVVSYNSTDANNPGVTAIVATTTATIGGAVSGSATPVAIDDHDIEVSVMGTGHGPRGAIGVLDDESNNAGHNLSHTATVDLASLFQDPDSARLFFAVAPDSASGLGTNNGSGDTYVFDGAAGGVLVFEVQGHTGKLTFNSDVYQGHDNLATDGTGNVITLNITARDAFAGGNSSASPADVNLRINVAPTDIWFADYDESGETFGTPAEATASVSVIEHIGSASAGPLGQEIALVDVQDQNMVTHKFGTHKVDLSGDDRFMITNTGNGKTDGDRNGSTWEVRLKPGAKLDYEAENADGNPTIKLTLTATDESGNGLSTPSAPAITLTVMVTNNNQDDGTPATPNDIPGLKDNDSTDNDETTEGDDADTDGGSPPPPGMSIGLIEDFVGNMDGFEQDILEDFMLIIDDGIDIA